MTFAQKYQQFLDLQQERFSSWRVEDHGAGGHVQMMKDVKAKDGSDVMVFYWNDEVGSIAQHPTEKNRFITVAEWDNPTIQTDVWNEELFKTVVSGDGDGVCVAEELANEVFDAQTVTELVNNLKELTGVHAKWEEIEGKD